jgi:hypothetical protein
MAHYAFIDKNNVVIEIIVGKDENDLSDGVESWEEFYGNFYGKKCLRTSYNTRGGVHYNSETGQPSEDESKAFRKNYAGIGFTYDGERDAFIPPKPYESWVLNKDTCLWDAPVPMPEDGMYTWDEETVAWIEVVNETN